MKKKQKSALNQIIRYYGASLEVMAAETGIPQNTIENYTSEVRTSIKNAKAINAQKIADYLCIDLHYLLEEEGWPLENYFTEEVLKLQNMLKPKRKKRKRKNPEYNEKVEKEYESCNALSNAKFEDLLKKLKEENGDEWIRKWITDSQQFRGGDEKLSSEQVNEATWRFKNLLQCYYDSRKESPDICYIDDDERIYTVEAKTPRTSDATPRLAEYLRFMNSFSGEGNEMPENEEHSISDKAADADNEN